MEGEVDKAIYFKTWTKCGQYDKEYVDNIWEIYGRQTRKK